MMYQMSKHMARIKAAYGRPTGVSFSALATTRHVPAGTTTRNIERVLLSMYSIFEAVTDVSDKGYENVASVLRTSIEIDFVLERSQFSRALRSIVTISNEGPVSQSATILTY